MDQLMLIGQRKSGLYKLPEHLDREEIMTLLGEFVEKKREVPLINPGSSEPRPDESMTDHLYRLADLISDPEHDESNYSGPLLEVDYYEGGSINWGYGKGEGTVTFTRGYYGTTAGKVGRSAVLLR
jgi:hypothetical protein